MASNNRFGVLHVFARTGVKYTVVPLSLTNLTIGSDHKAHVKVCRDEVDPIHCIIKVQSNGLALLVNMSTKNPVPINDKAVPKEMYLLPGDTFSIVGKCFKYENTSLASEDLMKARKWNYDKLNKCKRATLGRNLLTPQPEKARTFRPRRSASMDNKVESPERPRKPLGRFVRVLPGTEMVTPPAKPGGSRISGFTMSTPKSAVKPSLRNSAIFKNLTKIDYVEPECDPSSPTQLRQETLKTPVVDLLTDEEVATTPLNNTSVVIVNSPLREDKTPLRSRKSKAKDIAVQRLTHNDESVVVLETSDSKTPKSALKTTANIQIANISKTKLLDEFSDSEGGTPNTSPKKSDAKVPVDEILDLDESVVECSLAEEEELLKSDSENGSSSGDLKPSRKAENSFIAEDVMASSAEASSVSTPQSMRNTNKHENADSCSKSLDFKSHVSSTPAPRQRSAKYLDVSLTTGTEEITSDVESTELDTTTSDMITGGKRKRSVNSSTPEDNIKKKVKIYTDESVSELNSSSQDFTTENQCLEEPDENPQTPEPSMNTRRAFTEPKQTKRVVTRRSLSDRISNQENEPVLESNNTTCETVDTSSFVYVKNNVSFENTDFSSPVSTTDNSKKTQKEPLNDLTDVAGVKKLQQTPRASKESLNDFSSPVGVKRLLRTPKVQKDLLDVGMSGIKTLMKTPVQESKNKIDYHGDDTSVTNALNVSGISKLQDDEDIFPVKKVIRTYSKSLSTSDKNTTIKHTRKTVGNLVDVTPEVEKWVEESAEHLSRDDISEVNEECDIPETPTNEIPVKSVRKSIRLNLDIGENEEKYKVEVQWSKAGVSSVQRNRGGSLSVGTGKKIIEKNRKSEGAIFADLEFDVDSSTSANEVSDKCGNNPESAGHEGSDTDQDNTETEMNEKDINVQDASVVTGTEPFDTDDSVISLYSSVDGPNDEPALNDGDSDSVLVTSQDESIPEIEELVVTKDNNVPKSNNQEVTQSPISSGILSKEETILSELIDEDVEWRGDINTEENLVEAEDRTETFLVESTSNVSSKTSKKSMKVDTLNEKIDKQPGEDNVENHIVGRKSIRKSMKAASDTEKTEGKLLVPKTNRKSIKDEAEMPDTDVTSRKSIRKSHIKSSVASNDTEDKKDVEKLVARSIRKSTNQAEVTSEIVVARKSSRNLEKADLAIKSSEGPAVQDKTKNATNNNEKNRQPMESEKAKRSTRKSSIVPDIIESDTKEVIGENIQELEVLEAPISKSTVNPRKSVRKSTVIANLVESDSSAVMSENYQEPISGKSISKSVKSKTAGNDMGEDENHLMESTDEDKVFEELATNCAATSKKSTRQSAIAANVVESDSNEAISEKDQEPVARKSIRKSLKTKSTTNDGEEQENNPIVDNEVFEKPVTKSTVNLRKSTRKSTVIADLVEFDSSAAMSENYQEPVYRKSISKSVKTKNASNDVDEDENHPMEPNDNDHKIFEEVAAKAAETPRKSARKSSLKSSIRKSIKTKQVSNDEDEQLKPMQLTDDDHISEESAVKASRRNIRKSGVLAVDAGFDSKEPLSTKCQERVSRRSVSKSIMTNQLNDVNQQGEPIESNEINTEELGEENDKEQKDVTESENMKTPVNVDEIVTPVSKRRRKFMKSQITESSIESSRKSVKKADIISVSPNKMDKDISNAKMNSRMSSPDKSRTAETETPLIAVPRSSSRKSLLTLAIANEDSNEDKVIKEPSGRISTKVASDDNSEGIEEITTRNIVRKSEINEARSSLLSKFVCNPTEEVPVANERTPQDKGRHNICKSKVAAIMADVTEIIDSDTPKSTKKTTRYESKSTKKSMKTVQPVEFEDFEQVIEKTEGVGEKKSEALRKPKRSRQQKEPKNDLSNPLGVKELFVQQNERKELHNDLTDIVDGTELMTKEDRHMEKDSERRKSNVDEGASAVWEVNRPVTKETSKPTSARKKRELALENMKLTDKRRKVVDVTDGDDKEDEKVSDVSDKQDKPEKGKKKVTRSRRGQPSETKEKLEESVGEPLVQATKRTSGITADREVDVHTKVKGEPNDKEGTDDKANESAKVAESQGTVKKTRTRRAQKVQKIEEPENKSAESESAEEEQETESVTSETKPSARVKGRREAGKITKGKSATTESIPELDNNEVVRPVEIRTRGRRGRQISEDPVKESTPQISAKRSRRVPPPTTTTEESNQEASSVVLEVKESAKKITRSRRGKIDVSSAESPLKEITTPRVVKRSRRAPPSTTAENLQEDIQTEVTEVTERSTRSRGKQDSKVEDSATIMEEVSDEIKPAVGRESTPEVLEAKVSAKKLIRSRQAKQDDETSIPKVYESAAKARRGKKVVEETPLEPHVEGQQDRPKRGGRRAKVETVETSEVDKEHQTPVEKTASARRGGRRAKVDIEDVSEVGNEPEIPTTKKAPTKRGGRSRKIEEEEVPDIANELEILVEKAAPPKRGGRRAKIETTEEVVDIDKEPEIAIEKTAPIKRTRRGRMEARNGDWGFSAESMNKETMTKRGQNSESETVASDESTKPKRGRQSAEQVVQTEVEEVVTKRKTVKGVTVTTVTVNKKVTFDVEAASNGMQMEFTPKPRVTKRRLKSEDEMNMNTSDPIVSKKTRSRN